jgi:transglutaminase-like putative cysteine protease
MAYERESALVSVLRAFVLVTAACAASWDLALTGGLVAAGVGTVLGLVAGPRLARSPLRLGTIALVAALTVGLGLGLGSLVDGSAALAGALGIAGTLALADALRFGLLFAGVIALLRAAGARHRTARLLELGVVVLAFVRVLAVHREGAINRPLFLADWAWTRGIDPVHVLLWLGGAGALLLTVLLLAEQRRRRLVTHVATLLVLVLFAVVFVRYAGPPMSPAVADTLGLRGGKGQQPDPSRQRRGVEGGRGHQRGNPDEMPFQDSYDDQGKQVPVAVVVFGDDYSPPTGIYYFRLTAFSQFTGHRLVATTRPDADRDLVRLFPSAPTTVAPDWNGPERTPLDLTIALMADHTRPFALDYPARLRPLENPDPMRFRRAYEVTSDVLAGPLDKLLGRKAGSPAWSKELWAYYTETPSDPRYQKLADEIVGTLPERYRRDPFAEALAIKLWLDQNGIYSRRSSHAGADDPAGDFLFGDRIGYCVHFAHAAAYLMRARGLPTRVAAGYAAPESARGQGSTLLLRGGDAHAWPELYLAGVGWVTVDPTPARSLDQGPPPPDPGLTRMLGEMVKKGARPAPPPDELQRAARHALASLRAALRASVPFLLTALLLLYAIKAWRRHVPAFAAAAVLPRVAYRASLDRLGEVGLMRRFGETREAFARRAREVAPSLDPLTVVHTGAALGGRVGPPPDEVAALCERVRAELRTAVPLKRRLLGLVNPLSWIWTR